MGGKAYFIQYKFIIPDNMSHSNYTYQKLFRAIYGYTQTVTKSNGKRYSYHRKGILSDTPFIKQGKNCVTIPQEAFSSLKNFFLTGSNPTHKWRLKGDWKAVYYLNEKDIDDIESAKGLEELMDRSYVFTNSKDYQKLDNELKSLMQMKANNQQIDENYKKVVIDHAQKITNHPWFKSSSQNSQKLSELSKLVSEIKN